MPEPHLRASDRDRTAVATALGEHMAAGRLTLAEYEERLTQVYATKTFGGLAALTADLPPISTAHTPSATPTAARRPEPARAHGCAGGSWHGGCWDGDASGWDSWRRTAIIVLTIWAATSLLSWNLIYFWPVWVIGPWGAVLLARTVGGDSPGRPRSRDERKLPV